MCTSPLIVGEDDLEGLLQRRSIPATVEYEPGSGVRTPLNKCHEESDNFAGIRQVPACNFNHATE